MPHSEATRVIAIRHGETAWNVATRVQGHLDIPLNETGLWQARRMALALADDGIEVLYTSDLWRAYDTALALSRATGLDPVPHEGLRERGFGEFEGLTFAEIGQRWPEQSQRWRHRDPFFGPQGGERLVDFYARVITTVTQLASTHPGRTIALVAHGGVMDCLYRAALRLDLDAPRTWQLGNASINRLLYTPGGFTLVGWSDTFHLEGPSLDESADGETAPEREGAAALPPR